MVKKRVSGLSVFNRIVTGLFFCVSLLILCPESFFSLQITELFWGEDEWFSQKERFIEIYNNSPTNVYLSDIRLILPVSAEAVDTFYLINGSFEQISGSADIVSSVLYPYQSVVIMDDSYPEGIRPFAFSSNTLMMKSSPDDAFQQKWPEAYYSVGLCDDFGNPLFLCGDYDLESYPGSGESLSLISNSYVPGLPNPGAPGNIHLGSSARFIEGEGESVSVFLIGDIENTEDKKVLCRFRQSGLTTEIVLSHVSNGYDEGRLIVPPGLEHGEDCILEYGEYRYLIRYFQQNPVSVYQNRVVINEVVSDPVVDYSGGGWSGSNGNGLVNSTDDWFECYYSGQGAVDTEDWCLKVLSDYSVSVKNISMRYHSMEEGDKGWILPGEYAVFHPDSGIPESAELILYDGQPYGGGKIVDRISFGKEDSEVLSDNSSTGETDESLSRYPNACVSDAVPVVFRKQNATFGRQNAFSKGELSVFSDAEKNGVYHLVLSDSDLSFHSQDVLFKNPEDSEIVFLMNNGRYYYGTAEIKETSAVPYNRVCESLNGMHNRFIYIDQNPPFTNSADAVFTRSGWSYSEKSEDLSRLVVYPNPLKPDNGVLMIGNLPSEFEMRIYDRYGNMLKRWDENDVEYRDSGLIRWDVSLKSGVYYVVVRTDDEKKVLKLFAD